MAGFSRKKPTADPRNYPVSDGFDESDASDLNIRVKDRTGDDVTAIGKGSRVGGFFKETPMKGFKEGAADALKRPLTGIFRRPGSSLGRKRENLEGRTPASSEQVGVVDARSLSPDAAGSPSRVLPTTSVLDFDAVAKAPHLTPSQLHGMLQIDAFASKYPHLAKIDDLDISLLSRYLYTEDEVKDEDVPWTWDYIFASVSAELREEWAQEESDD
ncbi:hypothetical protein KIN20_010121 [Parelaphostrongylus tenuis]|uniref:Intraflagellar transport protein 43 homolog n=1 Tax=Parelaphostrongylus tenuis TaxID=148309 RepID=A0AAD5MRG6_PARTN|nr:hypothetical protein KIN20_010121 [Parelaphostrongylus tenuis]